MNLGDIFEEEEKKIRERVKNEKPKNMMIINNNHPSEYFVGFAKKVIRVSKMMVNNDQIEDLIHQQFKDFDIDRLFVEFQDIADPDYKYTNREYFVVDLVCDESATDLMKYIIEE